MEMKPELAQQLRQGFKGINRFMLWMWRLGLGQYINVWPEGIGRIMVLTHIGRKTGARRQNPVNYIIDDGDVYCIAGFGPTSDWYRNILKNAKVEVWLPDGWWQGSAEDTSHHPRRLELIRKLLIASGFVAPSLGLQPKTMSDEELVAATADYRLVRIRRTAACTGLGGPGELAWIWPAATFLLLPLALFRRRKG